MNLHLFVISKSDNDKSAIMTVYKRSEAIILRKAVNGIDQSAFMIITKTSEKAYAITYRKTKNEAYQRVPDRVDMLKIRLVLSY